jgi:Macrocin-O-methyltransferase (TylF)
VPLIAGLVRQNITNVRVEAGIAVLRLDAHWHESTVTCLETLYDRGVPGGLVIIDDYYV